MKTIQGVDKMNRIELNNSIKERLNFRRISDNITDMILEKKDCCANCKKHFEMRYCFDNCTEGITFFEKSEAYFNICDKHDKRFEM